jgi:hypothetical protein
MSQSWLNSLANSSLNATLEASDSVRNPLIYSTKEIVPAHAVSWSDIDPVTGGDVKTNGTTTFQLNKYGVISQILLNYDRTPTAAAKLPVNDFLKVIERIDLMCSSRTIATLTRDDLRAQFSNLTQSQFNPVNDSCIKERTAGTTAQSYCIPVHFGFQDHLNTCLDASFLEPLQLSITWGGNFNVINNAAEPAATLAAIDNCKLKVRYINMPENQVAKIISENYDSPELNILTSRYVDESAETVTASGTSTDVKFSLKSTECVENFYVMVYENEINDAATLGLSVINSVEFLSSGQRICKFTPNELNHINMEENGWAVQANYATADSGAYDRVVRIPLGYFVDHKLSNMASLREMSNAEIVVNFTSVNATQYRVSIVEECAALYSINSSSGRINLSLSN